MSNTYALIGRKTTSTPIVIGSRTALVFENDWFKAKNRIIVGWDFNSQTKKERVWDQVPVGAVGAIYNGNPLPPGAFLQDNALAIIK